ncbi:MAG: acyltransferase family protein [Pseudomonadota bacterium]
MQQRIAYLDALRGFLMTLGVFLHSARVYDSKQSWRIADGNSSTFFDLVVSGIHSFRMPVFFVIAGFFCWMALERFSRSQFLQKRLVRLLVPLVFTALTLNLFQYFFVNAWVNTSGTEVSLSHYWLTGEWVSHLWFLVNLIIYHGLAIGVFYALAQSPWITRIDKHKNTILMGVLGVLFIYPIVLGFVFSLLPALNIMLFNQIPFESLLFYIPYFFVGAALFCFPQFLTFFDSYRFYYLLLTLLIITLLACIHAFIPSGLFLTIITKLSAFLLPFILLGLLASWAKYWFDGAKPWVRNFSDASYTIYITHHLLVILVGFALSFVNVTIFIKYILLVSAVTYLSYTFHYRVVKHNRLLSFLFNGKSLNKKSTPMKAAQAI